MMRIALFLLTNLAVMVVFGLVLSLTGIQSSSMTGLLIMALLFGFGGSIVSLMMSKLKSFSPRLLLGNVTLSSFFHY